MRFSIFEDSTYASPLMSNHKPQTIQISVEVSACGVMSSHTVNMVYCSLVALWDWTISFGHFHSSMDPSFIWAMFINEIIFKHVTAFVLTRLSNFMPNDTHVTSTKQHICLIDISHKCLAVMQLFYSWWCIYGLDINMLWVIFHLLWHVSHVNWFI